MCLQTLVLKLEGRGEKVKAKEINVGIITVHSLKSHVSKTGHLLTWKLVFHDKYSESGIDHSQDVTEEDLKIE